MLTQQEVIQSHDLVVGVFKQFREELMNSYGNIAHSEKNDASPVTALDVKIELALKKRLLGEFPDFGFKGEETDEVKSNNDAVWLVDPIDSTNSFIHGLEYCSNMAALVIKDEVVASVIYHFPTDELFTAHKGQGAYKNGKKISVTNTETSNSIVFADAYSYKSIYDLFAPHKVKLFAPVGATGYFFTRLAQGSIQGISYLRANVQQHDIAPGMLIAQEAGAVAVSFTDEPFSSSCFRFMMGTQNICDIAKENRSKIIYS